MNKMFDTNTIAFGLAAFIIFLLLWARDPSLAKSAARNGLALLSRYSLLIVFSMMVAAMAPSLVPKQTISQYLGEASGWRGILLATLIGGLTPGAPYAVFPLIAGLMRQGMGIAPAVSMVCAWGLWSMGRVPFQAAVLGGRFTFLQVSVSLPLPIIGGALAGSLAKLVR